MKRMVIAACLVCLISGCATGFSGNAKLEGPVECLKTCEEWGMQLAGMVAMGDYTNGCICKVKGEHVSLEESGKAALMASSSAGGIAGASEQVRENDYSLLRELMSGL